MEQYNSDFYTNLCWCLIGAVAGIILIIIFVHKVISFKMGRDYIKMEIERSTKERELLYWQEELRAFYVRKIPIIGRFLFAKRKEKIGHR